jgi:hypothetical protein
MASSPSVDTDCGAPNTILRGVPNRPLNVVQRYTAPTQLPATADAMGTFQRGSGLLMFRLEPKSLIARVCVAVVELAQKNFIWDAVRKRIAGMEHAVVTAKDAPI